VEKPICSGVAKVIAKYVRKSVTMKTDVAANSRGICVFLRSFMESYFLLQTRSRA